jgi:hypothetical protein
MLLASGAITALSRHVEFIDQALAQTPDLTRDTLNGVAAFFVPGRDPYSLQQGESALEPGGLEAGAGEGLFKGSILLTHSCPLSLIPWPDSSTPLRWPSIRR